MYLATVAWETSRFSFGARREFAVRPERILLDLAPLGIVIGAALAAAARRGLQASVAQLESASW
jgi:hypothetical protein